MRRIGASMGLTGRHEGLTSLGASSYKKLADSEIQSLTVSNEKPRRFSKRRPLWKQGVFAWAMLAFVVLLINTIVYAVVSLRYGFEGGIGELRRGPCDDTKRFNTGAHLLINVFGSLLLSGSNYCMQSLTAPTRKAVDEAHNQGGSLYIGVPSLHNLRSIGRKGLILWSLIALSSLPLHFFYNSTVYFSIAAQKIDVYTVNESFARPDRPLNVTAYPLRVCIDSCMTVDLPEDISGLRARVLDGSFERLERDDCITTFARDFISDRRRLVLVTSQIDGSVQSQVPEANNTALLLRGPVNVIDVQLNSPDAFGWICDDPSIEVGGTDQIKCRDYYSNFLNSARPWRPFSFDVDYCMSERVVEECKVLISSPMLIIVICANAVKLIAMMVLALWSPGYSLLTIGDAIASFLREPDPTTKNCSLLDRSDFIIKQKREYLAKQRITFMSEYPEYRRDYEPIVPDSDPLNRHTYIHNADQDKTHEHKTYTGHRHRLIKANSLIGNLCLTALYFVAIGICVFLLVYGLRIDDRFEGLNLSRIFSIGLGVPSSLTTIMWDITQFGTSGLLSNVVIANLPQVIFSIIYFSFNSAATAMASGVEWANFASQRKQQERKGLRVSEVPQGEQRSSYFLSLPLRFSIPLLLLSALAHWLISQAIFLVCVEFVDSLDLVRHDNAPRERLRSRPRFTCGWSPLAVMLAIVLGGSMIFGYYIIGLLKYKEGMPLGANDSRVLSAACHPDEAEGEGLELKQLGWGVVSISEDGTGHCAMSSREREMPEKGRMYT